MKTSVAVTILAILSCSIASSQAGFTLKKRTLAGPNFGEALEMFFKAFQQIMPCGYAPGEIPVLAPFKLPYFPINVNNTELKVQGSISNFIATGMNDFTFVNFAYNNTNNRTTFDLNYPELHVLSEFDLNVWALLAGFPAQMSGNGLLNIRIKDFRMVGEIALAESVTNNTTGLRISDFKMNFFVGDVTASNWNNNWNIALNNFVNRWLRDFVLMWVEQIQAEMPEVYDYFLLPLVNRDLANVSMNDLITFFVSATELWNSSNCTSV